MSDARKINASNQNLFGGHAGNASHPIFTPNPGNASHPGNIGIMAGNPGTSGSSGIIPLMSWNGYIETVADLLAAGIITSDNYFKLKALMQSPDPEVRQLGLKFIEEKSKLEI
jgi:hypothetical protein